MVTRRTAAPEHSLRRAICVAFAAALLVSCAAPTPSPSGSGAPKPGGTLRIGVPPENGEPFLASVQLLLDPGGEGPSWFRRCCVARTLLSYALNAPESGGEAELVPDLATELPTVSADGLTWTVHMRAGLHYAPPFDELEISSRDIVRAIERKSAIDQSVLPGIEGLDAFAADPSRGISGLETPNATTLVVRLTSPDGGFAHRLAFAATSPIPEAALRANGTLADFVSSGPYLVESVSADGAILVRNQNWSRATDSLRPAYVDRIELVPVQSRETGLEEVAAGRLDLLTTFLAADQYRNLLRAGAGEHTISTQQNFEYYVAMNVANPPLDDVHVRRAIALLVDRKAITDALEADLGSLFEVADHMLPDVVANGLLTDYDPLADESGSLAAAQAEMRQSTYDHDGDGTCDDPVCRRLLIIAAFGRDEDAGRIAKVLPQLGMKAEVDPQSDWTDPRTAYHLVAGVGWGVFGPIGSEYSLLWESGTLGVGGGVNLSLVGASRDDLQKWGYAANVPSLDGTIHLCKERLGSSAFRCWAELDQLVMEQVAPVIPIATAVVAYRLSDRVTAVEMSPTEAIPAIDTIQVSHAAAPG